MRLDDAILEELERGEGTVAHIIERISGRVRHALDRLEKSKQVVRENLGGKNNELVYKLTPGEPITRRF